MSTAESPKTLAGQPWPNGDPSTWVYVADLPTPAEVAAEVEEKRRQMGWWWHWWWKRDIEYATEYAKCEHYFLGKQVVYKQTPRGMLVVLVGEPCEENHAWCAAAAQRGEPVAIRTFYDWSKARDWYHV
jgi:hypothetical protein